MDILQQIIDMDKAAVARVKAAADEQRRLDGETDETAAKSLNSLLEAERSRCEGLKTEQESALAEKRSESEERRVEQCGRLDEAFARNRDRWKSEILARVTGV